jgi:hypothetical protein
MKKVFYLLPLVFLLNGCVESVALLGSTAGGASSGRLVQSTLQSTISYGIKKQTGKTPLGHALAYAEKNNPDRKKETCISFIEKTKSEFCTIAKKKISSTNKAVKKKLALAASKDAKITNSAALEIAIKPKIKYITKDSSYTKSFDQLKKSPRELSIFLQAELKKLKNKIIK